MADPELVKEWLEKADEDYRFAASIVNESTFYAQICFHFHQAGEKFLKAFIVAHDLEFKKIHDLPVLLKMCSEKNSALNSLLSDCNFLNRFYIDTRYPVHWPSNYTKDVALEAMKCVDRIRSAIESSLGAK
jgi:HEPN domain-containing protein